MNQLQASFSDVVIAGGGLAGLTLGLQLRQRFPDWTVTIVEKSVRPLPDAAHKVGESSVELGSFYLGQMLGLADYLADKHYFKYGLRFFPGGGQQPLHTRRELGPAREPIVPSYQMDRGRLENDLRAFFEDAGGRLLEGVQVDSVELGQGDASHTIRVQKDDSHKGSRNDEAQEDVLQSRWFFDATGRVALLRRDLKLTRGSPHRANSSWFRVKGRVDITTFVDDEHSEWHDNEWAAHRWRSTNHLMGKGYWLWLIPLSTGHTSIGLVVHDAVHGFRKIQSLEKLQEFIAEHEPHIWEHIRQHEVVDFRAIRNYSHNLARSFSADRWGMVGEAGAFVDPLYSPGTDFIAFANTFATELVRVDREGEDLETRTRELNLQYRSLVAGAMQLYANAAPVYGHADAMFLKLYWDNFWYWSFPCQFFFQKIYEQSGQAFLDFSSVGQRFVSLSGYLQSLVTRWADIQPALTTEGFGQMPGFPSRALDAHLALEQEMTFEETLEYVRMRAVQAEEFVAEALVRVLFTLGEEDARTLAEELQIHRWEITIPRHRIEAERVTGLQRRRQITDAALDVQRTLGRHPQTTPVDTVLEICNSLIIEANLDNRPMPTATEPAPQTPTKPAEDSSSHRAEVLEMIGGKWVSATIGAAAQLGLPAALAQGPLDLRSLATTCALQPTALERLLLALCSLGVLTQTTDERYALTPKGQELLPGKLGELAEYISSDFAWAPWARLADSVRTGVSAFEIAKGNSLFHYLERNDRDAEIYDKGVNAFTQKEAEALVQTLDLRDYNSVLDLGGGRGTMLLELLKAAPHLHGILFDLESVIERSRLRPEFDAFQERISFVHGDFTTAIPQRADLIILRHILHNWSDADAKGILRNAREALAAPEARLLIIEGMALPPNYPDPTRLMDMEMMVLFGDARERSKPEFRQILRDTGLRLEASGSLSMSGRWLLASARKP